MLLAKYIFISMFAYMMYFLITDLQLANSAVVVASDMFMVMLITILSVSVTFSVAHLIDYIKHKFRK